MKLLLVEDDDNKRSQIEQLIHESVSPVEIICARSLKTGIKALQVDKPEVILLDMALPTFDVGFGEAGGDTHTFGGREFLQEMRRFELEIPVVVITQYETFDVGRELRTLEALNAELRRDYGSFYKGAIYYHAAIQSWKDELRALMSWGHS